jgi:hypothetical protein
LSWAWCWASSGGWSGFIGRIVLLIVLVALIANYGSHLAQHRHALPRVTRRAR